MFHIYSDKCKFHQEKKKELCEQNTLLIQERYIFFIILCDTVNIEARQPCQFHTSNIKVK